MIFDDFIKKYAGKKADWDGAYGAQCVDLYRFYVKEVLNLPQSPAVPGAADIWNNIDTSKFTRILNTPTGVPQKGDIVIWNKKAGGGFGHVGIFVSGDVMKFISFDQNWPVGSGCHYQNHDYTNVTGWLRAKNSSNSDDEKFNKIMSLKDQPGSNTEKIKKIEKIIHA